jgi:hypothetical protein
MDSDLHVAPLRIRSTKVELHWNIEIADGPFKVDVEGLWERAQPFRSLGRGALALSTEDMILHVCIHGSYHHGEASFDKGIYPVCDLAYIIDRYRTEIQWDVLWERASQWRCTHAIALMLTLCQTLLGQQTERLIPLKVADVVCRRFADIAFRLIVNDHYVDFEEHFPALSATLLRSEHHRTSMLRQLKYVLLKTHAQNPNWKSLTYYWRLTWEILDVILRSRQLWKTDREKVRMQRWLCAG